MNGDLSTDHRVAAINAHRILRRAAGEGPKNRGHERAPRETPKGASGSRRPKQD